MEAHPDSPGVGRGEGPLSSGSSAQLHQEDSGKTSHQTRVGRAVEEDSEGVGMSVLLRPGWESRWPVIQALLGRQVRNSESTRGHPGCLPQSAAGGLRPWCTGESVSTLRSTCPGVCVCAEGGESCLFHQTRGSHGRAVFHRKMGAF